MECDQTMTKRLIGVGVGPGDPELITLKAHRFIKNAKVIAYPAPDSGESFARSIVAEFFPQDVIEIPIIIPMRDERFPAKEIYDQAAISISSYLDQEQEVIVLCEGDPFFYGSFMYLFERLADKYPTLVVPGVSSMTACAAQLGAPLAGRNEILSVIPATLSEEILMDRLQSVQSAAIIKVGKHFNKVKQVLTNLGLLDVSGYVERATLPNQVVCRLNETDFEVAPYFSMILVNKGENPWKPVLQY